MALDKLVDSAQLDADLTSVANAIRTKGGTSASLAFPAGFVSAIGDIPTGGGGISLDDIATNTEPSGAIILGNAVTEIAEYAFAKKPITSVSAPEATDILAYAFRSCPNLKGLYFPKVTKVWTEAFIVSAVEELTDAQFPLLTDLIQASFGTMTSLKKVFLSRLATVPAYCWDACSNLETAVLPNSASTGGQGIFRNCSKLAAVDMNKGNIQNNTFNGCSVLKTLVIRSSTAVTLSNINAFGNTPFASGKTGGTLYVPNSLLSTYQSASNWSTINGYTNNQIKSIESTHTDPNAPIDLTTHYADGTLIPA